MSGIMVFSYKPNSFVFNVASPYFSLSSLYLRPRLYLYALGVTPDERRSSFSLSISPLQLTLIREQFSSQWLYDIIRFFIDKKCVLNYHYKAGKQYESPGLLFFLD